MGKRGDDRLIWVGETPYPHEREGIEFAFDALRESGDTYHALALVELCDRSSGQLYEIDLIVIGYHAVFLIEIKGHPGTFEGDEVDWLWTTPEGRTKWISAPYRLTNHKAKVLSSRLQREVSRRVWVQPLVFLSDPDINIRLRGAGRMGVVNRNGLRKALTQGEFEGRPERFPQHRIPGPTVKEILTAFKKMGLRPRRGKAQVGDYDLRELLQDTREYQDRQAVHSTSEHLRRRARIYLVPEQTSAENRMSCQRKAEREVQLLHDVGQHPGVLTVHDFHATAPLGPTVLLEDFEGGLTLDRYLAHHPGLAFEDRLEILEQVCRALAHCHRKGVFHGGLGPEAILVRGEATGIGGLQIETRLFNFQFGAAEGVSPTVHRTMLGEEGRAVYQPPELRYDPSATGAASDCFSLGAVAHLLFTGEPPARDVLDLEARLERDGALDPRAVSDGLDERVAGAIVNLTARVPMDRVDDVEVFIECLLDELTTTSVTEEEEEVSPLEARKGATLAGEYTVLGILGHGASARVLRVERDGKQYALKVSLSEEHDERIAAEGALLRGLHHHAIVAIREPGVLTIGGRTCLLMAVAGRRTLARRLSEDGPLDVDEAQRYGEDLFAALEHLFEADVLHRDIKPANIGVGSAKKKARHLTLFDFSAAGLDRAEVKVGTTAYRDPSLERRGHWDAAGDRWSAAITLHEAITGLRPRWRAPGEPLILAAERFDAAARDRLVTFFNRALHPEVDQRFDNAREMRRAWLACFDDPVVPQEAAIEPAAPPIEAAPDRAREPASEPVPESEAARRERMAHGLARVTLDSALDALPLSVRARNALDRAGLTRMGELLELPDNRLSAIRGIGSKVAGEIFLLREVWRDTRTADEAPGGVEVFFPGYRGEDQFVVHTPLPTHAAQALEDAGLARLAAVAACSKEQVEGLARRARFDLAALRSYLEEQHSGAEQSAAPTTVEAWIEALLPPRLKSTVNLERLFGLSDRGEMRIKEVARAAGVTRQRIYQQLKSRLARWSAHPQIEALRELGHRALDRDTGVAPLDRAARQLARVIPHDESASPEQVERQCAALLQILARVDAGPGGEGEGGDDALTLVRIHDRPWIALGPERATIVRELGEEADRLAARAVLASPGVVERRLRTIVEASPLSGLDREALVTLAAEASRKAARSSRLEIYPRGLDPKRAIDLSAQVLTGALSPDEVIRRVGARYPEAAPLPEGEALTALLEPLGLAWDPGRDQYTRPDAVGSSTPSTSMPLSRMTVQAPSPRAKISTGERERRDFVYELRTALENHALRVLQLDANRVIEGVERLSAFLRERAPAARVVHLDRELFARMLSRAQDEGLPEELLYDTDAEGPEGEAWENLRELAEGAAASLADELLPARAPTLLVQPGLLERYELTSFLQRLLVAAERGDGEAVFLLVPAHDRGGPPMINERLPVPGLSPGQRARVPLAWLKPTPEPS